MGKTIEETYQMLSQHEHVLKRPDTYIGSVVKQKELAWTFNEKIQKKQVEFTPGLLKIVDEAVSNATDHAERHQSVTKIKIDVSKETGEISVYNDGPGIPVVLHTTTNMYVPEMIFGNLLTGSNFDDTQQRTGAGRNGLGITLTAIFSKKFKVETLDSQNAKKFTQVFSNNMKEKSKPKIVDCSSKSYTKVTFTPDYQKFGMDSLEQYTFGLLKRRAYECVACTNKNVTIYFNGEKLSGKGLLDYAKFFTEKQPLAHEINGKWEYLVFQKEGYEQVSFVNGNNTSSGGKHVDYILNQIISGMKEKLEKKLKDQTVKSNTIKDNLFIFVKCTIPNPTFNSQSKELLTTHSKDFGSVIKVSDNFINKIYKSGITQEVLDTIAFKNRKQLDKNISTTKKSKMVVKNLEDATNAGTSKSSGTMLIITEGLSASSFAVSGLGVVGRANYGIFSLKGKVLNIREATQSQLLKNEEIISLKKIIGLNSSKTYQTKEELDTLRYGSIGLLADSDVDGIHITSLVMNFIHFWWPALIKKEGFIKSIRTPIVKLKSGNIVKKFYNEMDYKNFIETDDSKKWVAKYYKGLGTSTSTEAKETFKELKNNTEIYIDDKECDSSFRLAFEKKKADDRKNWLKFMPDGHAKRNEKGQITYSDFINKELIYFSTYDNVRSIPHLMDGLKPSQRKVLYTAFKRNLNKEMKVAQFGASVAEETAYHHGEVSLSMTIVNMAQDYPGSNNINLLEPCGNFGYRNHNGKDAASPRYIFTHLSKATHNLFLKDDEKILEYNEDDGKQIEPKFYVPTLPMVLINGSVGIGTGYSTNIPCYKPEDIKRNIQLLLKGNELPDLVPWVRGFNGTITKEGDTSFLMKGVVKKVGNNLVVEEIPTNISISDYKDFLETFEEFNVKNESTENTPKFTLIFKNPEDIKKFDHKTLKLVCKINTSNMHLFTVSGELKKYQNPNEIIIDFVKCKLEYLQKRKNNLIKEYKETLLFLKNKKRFLEAIIDDSIQVYKKSKSQIETILETNKFDKIKDSYNYLVNLPISSFNLENLEELNKNISKTEALYKINSIKTPVQYFIEDLNK
jgi:DNA topoisomerase-2